VEPEVRSVDEDDFPNLWSDVAIDFNTIYLFDVSRSMANDLAEFMEALDRRKTIWFQDQFGFKVLHRIERMPVRIRSLFGLMFLSSSCSGRAHATSPKCSPAQLPAATRHRQA